MLKVEYVHRRTFTTRTEARLKIATWITGFYNTRRLHSVCGYRSPIDDEQDHQAGRACRWPAGERCGSSERESADLGVRDGQGVLPGRGSDRAHRGQP
ncbi:IS3 family transposase [Streptomyces sp. NPDC007905]|uniref:IS3 family transposase n=1 Tax=Streptomyces sp. NPDC007905 TaxID=3364788 RepID=UPI0036E5F8B1